jgi:hypothetical protein
MKRQAQYLIAGINETAWIGFTEPGTAGLLLRCLDWWTASLRSIVRFRGYAAALRPPSSQLDLSRGSLPTARFPFFQAPWLVPAFGTSARVSNSFHATICPISICAFFDRVFSPLHALPFSSTVLHPCWAHACSTRLDLLLAVDTTSVVQTTAVAAASTFSGGLFYTGLSSGWKDVSARSWRWLLPVFSLLCLSASRCSLCSCGFASDRVRPIASSVSLRLFSTPCWNYVALAYRVHALWLQYRVEVTVGVFGAAKGNGVSVAYRVKDTANYWCVDRTCPCLSPLG